MPRPRWPLRRACEVVWSGGVIAYPTEAVFGLGCDPLEVSAVKRILAIKMRDASKGLILIGAGVEQLLPYLAPLNHAVRAKLETSGLRPVTWVVPAAHDIPSWISGGRSSLAVRVTRHPIARGLCEATGMALISTSANCSGRPPARSALQARSHLRSQVDYIVPGATGLLRRPTEIRDALTEHVLRAG